jgi:hypothetical protein
MDISLLPLSQGSLYKNKPDKNFIIAQISPYNKIIAISAKEE